LRHLREAGLRKPATEPTLAAAGPCQGGISLDEESDEEMGLPHDARDTSGYINSEEQNEELPEHGLDRFNQVQKIEDLKLGGFGSLDDDRESTPNGDGREGRSASDDYVNTTEKKKNRERQYDMEGRSSQESPAQPRFERPGSRPSQGRYEPSDGRSKSTSSKPFG